MIEPQKRPAFEPPRRLLQPVAGDQKMKRPASTVAGVLLVLLSVLATIALLIEVAVRWDSDPEGASSIVGDLGLEADDRAAGLTTLLVTVGIVLLIEVILAVLIFLGRNWPRVVVMAFSALSISSVFTAWWVQGQEVTLRTSLVSLAFDILVLLALSSRSAAAYARRNERARGA
jgi:hypothetical protein